MIVYHGSYKEIKEIDLSMARPNKDFGAGFYTTNIREQAEVWARIKGDIYGSHGVVTGFKFAVSAFSDNYYKTLRFSEYSEEWFEFIVKNRDTGTNIPVHDYDIVEGPVADDKVTSKINDYLRGEISAAVFFREISKYPHPTHQICFCTVKSLNSISRIDLKILSRIENMGYNVVENIVKAGIDRKKALEQYLLSETFAILQDESSRLYEKSWQEIYEMLKKEIGAGSQMKFIPHENA